LSFSGYKRSYLAVTGCLARLRFAFLGSACNEKYGITGCDLADFVVVSFGRDGVDLVTVSKILGHSSIQMTMRYAHPTPENMLRAVDKLGQIFENEAIKSTKTFKIEKLKTLQIMYN